MHVHDFGMTSVEWVIQNVTYRDNLYMCIDSATDSLKFGWFSNPPQLDAECLWMNVKDTRTLLGNYVKLEIKPCGLGSRIRDMEADMVNIFLHGGSQCAFSSNLFHG